MITRYVLFAAIFALFFGGRAFAQIPETMSYQGILTDASGRIVADGSYRLTFKLYESPTSGPLIWEENQGVTVADGLFNVILGGSGALNVKFDKQYWLGIAVDGGSEMQPRIQLTASAYSLNARSLADSAVTGATIANGSAVRSLNGLTDKVTLDAGNNIVISENGNSINISASTAGGLTLPFSATVDEIFSVFSIFNQGEGSVGSFQNLSETSIRSTLDVVHRGVGAAGIFGVTKSDNPSPAMRVVTKGVGAGLVVEHAGVSGNIAEFKDDIQKKVTIDRGGNVAAQGDLKTGGEIVFADGTRQFTAAVNSNNSWLLSGNTNLGASNFIGTKDTSSFRVKVFNTTVLEVQYAEDPQFSSFSPNIVGGALGNGVDDGVFGAFVGGGGNGAGSNRVTGEFGAVVGGNDGSAADFAIVGGGSRNQATATASAVLGGAKNSAKGGFAFIGGGEENEANADHATVSGGKLNRAEDLFTTISGGELNVASKSYGTIGGGQNNTAEANYATVSGGQSNHAIELNTTVGGGKNNSAKRTGDTVAGGENNVARNEESGGATVGGGEFNQALSDYATVAGGQQNIASGSNSFIGGGRFNVASAQTATVSGGERNQATKSDATVGGGDQNIASGQAATVPGGDRSHARGDYSFAAGYKARAVHNGSFVWNDRSVTNGNDSLATTAANQFLIRAAGGVGIGTATPGFPLQMGSGAHVTAGGVWTNASSRSYKENITSISADEAVSTLENLNPVKYVYKNETDEEYLGFIAEDVPDLVATKDRKSLSPMDIVAIMTKVVQEQQAVILKLQKRVAALEDRQ